MVDISPWCELDEFHLILTIDFWVVLWYHIYERS